MYKKFLILNFREAVMSRPKLLFSGLFVSLRIGVLLVAYSYACRYTGKTNIINATVWSMAVYHVLLSFHIRGVCQTIQNEMRNGSLETTLVRPLNYPLWKAMEQLGINLPPALIALCILPLWLTHIVAIPSLSWVGWLGLALLSGGGVIASAMLILSVGLLAAWMEDVVSVYWMVDKSVMVLGGSYLPVFLMPTWMQNLASWSPMGAPMLATQAFRTDFLARLPFLLISQAIWISLGFCFLAWLNTQMRRKISIHGG